MKRCNVRRDGKGDFFANEHRAKLPFDYLMSDIDNFGILKSEDTFFCENVRIGEKLQICALYDRKNTTYENNKSKNKRLFYAYIARCIGSCQELQPKFFEICGADYPLTIYEIDIETLQRKAPVELTEKTIWTELYKQLGINEIRYKIKDEIFKGINNKRLQGVTETII